MNSHQIVDLIVLAVLLYCMVKGASRGLLSQLAWVVALLLCFKFSGTLAPAIEPMISVAPPMKQWIAMLAVYVGLCGLSFVVAGMLSKWMEKARVIDFDRHLGGLLGLVKGIVICMTAMFFAITMSEPMRQIVSKTYSGYGAAVILNNSQQYLIPLLPEHTVAAVRNVIDEFNRRLQPGIDDLGGAVPSSPDSFGGGEGFDLSKIFSGRGSDSGSSSGSENGTSSAPSYQDILSQLPAQLQRELTQQLTDKVRTSSPEERERLLDQLKQSLPEDATSVLSNFLRSTGTPGGQGTATSQPAPGQLGPFETTLLNEIAGVYSQRTDIPANTRKYLAGVPTVVQRRVLEDWHADALGLQTDPDSMTDINTRLDDRIVRQLARAGISMEGLDRDLRTRLSDAVGLGRN